MFQVVINASFHWPLLGNKPPPKLNSIKQLSFYLLLVLRVSVLDCGQAVGSGCWSVPCQPTVGSRIVRRLADFFKPPVMFFESCFLVTSQFSVKDYEEDFVYCGRFCFLGIKMEIKC